jgi:hypothetical protein
MGGALGVGFLGATLGFEFAGRLNDAGAKGLDVVAALRPETHARLEPSQLALVQTSLGITLRDVFLIMFVVAIVTIISASRLIPGRPPTPGSTKPGEPATDHPDYLELAAMPD